MRLRPTLVITRGALRQRRPHNPDQSIPRSRREHKMNLKILSLLAAVLLVAACQQSQPPAGQTTGSGQATTTGGAGTIAQRLVEAGNTIYFSFDRSDITNESRQVLVRQAALL